MDRETLAQHAEGLICLSACMSGEVALWLRQGAYDRAREAAEWHARTFGDGRYWLEVQNHGLAEEPLIQEGVFRLAEELGLGVVATNDAHYLTREDAAAHDVLLAIRSGKDLNDPKRFRFEGSESYVKSEEEMRRAFPPRDDLFANTQAIAERCEFDFEKRFFLPEFPRPAEYASDNDLVVALAEEGARRRYGEPLPPPVRERLDYELGVITKVGYAGYFLIVADFIRWAREHGIPVGPGRGSAAGSLVSYALGITNVDPLKFDLLFERFLNPERISPPDIDVDFCEERRGEVIEYVRERYGRASVGPDRHLRHDEGARGGEGRGPRARRPAGRRRPAHQADPQRPRLRADPPRGRGEGAGAAGAGGAQPHLPEGGGVRERHRGAVAPHLGARRRDRDRAGSR